MTSALRATGRCGASTVMASCTRRGARLITTSCVSHKIITSHFPSPKPSSTNLTSQILKDSSKWANQIATECGVTHRRYSFSQLVDRIARWAGMLNKLGIKKGDFVAIIMLNCPEYPIVMLGAISIGAIVTGVNPTYTPGEILRQLEDSGAKLVIGDTFSEKKIDAALAEYKKPTVLVINGPSTVDGALDLLHILEDSSLPFADPVEVSGKDLALMPYSSGTTGKPKGVALSHSAVASNVTMLVHPSVFTSHETTDSYQDSFLCYLPYYHVYGIVPIMMTGLQMGVKLVSTPKFDPNTFVKDIRQHKVGTLHLVPPVLNFLNQSPTVTPEALASLHTTLCGAAPVLVTDVQAFKERIKKPLFFQESKQNL
nr:4-coumarate--CoA ligase 3-like [Procambarus clarkii]